MIIGSIDEIPSLDQPCGLTIGNFDGVHLGHQMLLNDLRKKLPKGIVVAFTFSNHPSHYFTPENPVPLICSPQHRAKLLEAYGADLVILTPFTSEFSQMPYDHFLGLLKQKLNFTYLSLGTGATFGKNREGNEKNVKDLAEKLKFKVEYLPKLTLHGVPLSSGYIRTLISKGALQEVQECLGRPYSLMGQLRFDDRDSSYALETQGICLPPPGIYSTQIKASSTTCQGKAHILPQEGRILLEPLDKSIFLNSLEVEVVFL
jgi:riboflavin kinase/FMN adenylyltransferase